MKKRILQLFISLSIASVFIWFAFRSVDLQDLATQMKSVKLGP